MRTRTPLPPPAGPRRTEYEITERGTETYLALLRESLVAHDQRPDALTSALGCMVDLPRQEVLQLLAERVRRMEEWRGAVMEHYVPEDGPEKLGHVGELMNFWVHSADTGAAWTRGLIARIEGGAYTFAGEGEPFAGVLADGQENPYATGAEYPGDGG